MDISMVAMSASSWPFFPLSICFFVQSSGLTGQAEQATTANLGQAKTLEATQENPADDALNSLIKH
jgi:hypothetical protein